jgi:hypothetical protein
VSVTPSSGGVDGAEIAALIERWPGMSFFAAPTMVKRLAGDASVAAADLANLTTIIYGGAPMYLADLESALDVFGPRLAQIYGQGETPMTITALSKADHAATDHPHWRERMQSVGTARTDVELRVVDDDDGRNAATGETGEIIVRGDVVTAGYWNQPEATAESVRDGWLHTGDLGSVDAAVYLTLRDRSKDLIISGGMNIYPREVEEALLRHPGVSAVSVVGRPDPEWGEAVVAYVVAGGGESLRTDDLDRPSARLHTEHMHPEHPSRLGLAKVPRDERDVRDRQDLRRCQMDGIERTNAILLTDRRGAPAHLLTGGNERHGISVGLEGLAGGAKRPAGQEPGEISPHFGNGDPTRHEHGIAVENFDRIGRVGLAHVTLQQCAAVDVRRHSPRSSSTTSMMRRSDRAAGTSAGRGRTGGRIQPSSIPSCNRPAARTGLITALGVPRSVTITCSPRATRSRNSESRCLSSRTPTSMWTQ